ncbi:MAG TPA: transcription-repair coupling factor [Solirubrobacteraceae bacterium]|nr:transcription-repair coupling factor [Solirubrobacteraceae bacterium]
MALRSLLAHFTEDPGAARLAREGGHAYASTSLRPYAIAGLLDADPQGLASGRPALVVVGDDRAARDLAVDLRAWLAPRKVRYYPSRGVTYQSHLLPPAHLVGLRVAALDALLDGGGVEPPVVVVSAVALSEKVPDPALRPHSLTLRRGDRLDLEALLRELVSAGYERVDQVEDRGQVAVRGGLLDIFPATEERAVRVDLFDDEIDTMRWFSTFTQRSLGEADEVEIAPAAELAEEHREDAELAALMAADGEDVEVPDIADLLPVDRFRSLLELIGERWDGRGARLAGGSGEGAGPAAPDRVRRGTRAGPASPPTGVALLVAAEEEIDPSLKEHWEDVCAAFHDRDAHHLYVAPERVRADLDERAALWLSGLAADQPIELRAQTAEIAARSPAAAEPELEKLVRGSYRTVVAWTNRGEGERAAYNMARLRASWIGEGDPPTVDGALRFAVANLREGFIAPSMRLAVIPEHRLVRRRLHAAAPAVGGRGRGVLRSFTDLRTGDIVVHEDHGIARFAGFETRTVAGVTRDYLYLEYQGDDRVFVPTDQLAKLSRYVGAGGAHPPLSKLGGTRWETMKARARRAAQELAGELLALYTERRRRAGHAFPPDGDWQREFEARFPYQETPDQREAIELVKLDMESERPMDRLICGDVGYGKTEVALRAAFKAASDGKQVMVLAPTTILAQQHFGTFSERLRDFPITVDFVSRFRSAAEQRAAVKAFSEGKVDILIGTHRLLSRDVRAKELGLLILDEEQRFGVKQKELLRQLKLKVDVIAMSATPIPRTLQMSLAGLRDISVIETPPEGRRPVKTYVGEYDEQLVKQAIEREHGRGGQAFFLHNRVESIDETAERLRALCPGVRFVVGHGQMAETELEDVMLGYLRGEADVLVCTSIIESGIDIPQANTLIVEHSDAFGLSQLYQIRGRVGRSRERAYAYLLYDSAAALSAQGAQRLAALSDHTELGSGFRIAMRDLELRGAGNLLGDEQSGHVAALGFELYMQMLDEAVRAAEPLADEEDLAEPVRLDVSVDAYVPADYVPYEQAKIDVHRRVASAREVADVEQLREELEDRFGPVPEPLVNLLSLQRARIKFGQAGARNVSFRGDRLAVTPIELDSVRARRLREEIPEARYESGRSQVSVRVPAEGAERFPAVVRAADVLLAVTREAA